jgi:hypothetical protein
MSDLTCEHKDNVCKLVYTIETSGRVHLCKLCGKEIPCNHFKIKPATLSYKHTRRQKIVETLSAVDAEDLDLLV